MDETTSVLFGLDDHRVLGVTRVDERVVRVVIEPIEREGACPVCGVLSARVKDRPLVRLRDLPASGQRVQLWCRRRRLACREPDCPRLSFTPPSAQVPARARLTARLREELAAAIAGSNRAVADVAAEHEVSWHTAHRALVAAAAHWLPEPTPTRVLGIDETRTRTVRWILEEAAGRRMWRRSDPWMTSFVDADPTRAGLLLGLAPGRSGSCVRAWLGEQTQAFRDAVELVVIDPSAPYASGIRAALPAARIAVDKWHLVRLANEAVTEVRQRVTREQHGHRGTLAQPVWVHRRMLLTADDRLSARQLTRGGYSPATTRPGKSAPPGRSRSGCASCSRRSTPSGSATPCGGSTTPPPQQVRRRLSQLLLKHPGRVNTGSSLYRGSFFESVVRDLAF